METVNTPVTAATAAEASPAATDSKSVPLFTEEVESLSQELMGYIADKWTLVVLESLYEHGVMRFTELRKRVPGISQKMLTQTLRQMERNGLVSRKVHAVIPPRVEYGQTELGRSLGAAVCGLWTWVEDNAGRLSAARKAFDSARPAE